MATTIFYCDPVNGNNMWGGSDNGSAPKLSLTGGDFNGTTTYTKTGAITGVAVGDYAHIFPDGGSTPALIARVTATTANTLTLSTTLKWGSQASGTANRSVHVGGAFKGPNGTDWHPFNFIGSGGVSNGTTGDLKIVLKNSASYAVTASLTTSKTNITYEGYSSTVGDGGKATIDGGGSGASYNVILLNSSFQVFKDIIFYRNGSTGVADLIANGSSTTGHVLFINCVFTGSKGAGFMNSSTSNTNTLLGCEAYSNAVKGFADFWGAGHTTCINCIAHDNTGAGFHAIGRCINCIADTNNASGVGGFNQGASCGVFINCDSYNNTGAGFYVSATSVGAVHFLQNCNAVKNSTYGFDCTASTTIGGWVTNCGYGKGTQVNTSGDSRLSSMTETGKVSYANNVTPWNAPTTGDFTLILADAQNAGVMTFTQTQGSYTGTVAYASIGAATPSQAGGGSTTYVLNNKLIGVG